MEKLKVKNFGPISDIDITLKKINIFIGEQGVGKSTVAKLLTSLRNILLHYAIIEQNNEALKQLLTAYDLFDMFTAKTVVEYSDDAIGILLTYHNGEFNIKHNLLPRLEYKKFCSSLVSTSIDKVLEKQGIDGSKLQKDELQTYINKYGRTMMSYMHLSLYCPAERAIIGELSRSLATLLLNDIPLPTNLLEYMSFFEKARNYFKTYTIDFLKLNFKVSNNEDCIEFDGKTVPLRLASSGIQSILPLMMVMDYCLKEKFFSSFTIEEPELNLFPSNQMGLLRFILSRTSEDYAKLNSFTLTTHSPYILSILNISILGGAILKRFPDAKEEVEELLPFKYIVNPDDICVYALNNKSGKSCENLIDPSTGLISANYLDSVSDTLSTEFNQLNRLLIHYVRSKR